MPSAFNQKQDKILSKTLESLNKKQGEILSEMLEKVKTGKAKPSHIQDAIGKLKKRNEALVAANNETHANQLNHGIKILENALSSEKKKIILKSTALTIAIPTLTGSAALGGTVAIGAGMAGIFTALGFSTSAFALSAPLIISATAFLTSNPVGWGILIGVGILSIGAGIYYGQQKFFSNNNTSHPKNKIHNTIATFKEKIFGNRETNAHLETARTNHS